MFLCSLVVRQLAQIWDSIFSRFAIAFGSQRTTKSTARIPILPPVCAPLSLLSPFLCRHFSLSCLCPPVHNYLVCTAFAFVLRSVFFRSCPPHHLHTIGNRANSDTENMAKSGSEKSYHPSCIAEMSMVQLKRNTSFSKNTKCFYNVV